MLIFRDCHQLKQRYYQRCKSDVCTFLCSAQQVSNTPIYVKQKLLCQELRITRTTLFIMYQEQENPRVTTILIRPKFCVMNYICPANRVCGNPERPCHPGLGCAGAANRPGLDNTDIYLGLEPAKQHVETRQNKITMHQKYKQKGKTTRLALLCVHSW